MEALRIAIRITLGHAKGGRAVVMRANRIAALAVVSLAVVAAPIEARAQTAAPPSSSAPAAPPATQAAPVAQPVQSPQAPAVVQPVPSQQPVYVQQPYGQPVPPQQPVYVQQPYGQPVYVQQPVYAPPPYGQPVYVQQPQPVYAQPQPVYAPQPVVVQTPITYAPNSLPPSRVRGYRGPPDIRAIVSGGILFGLTYIPSFVVAAYCIDNTSCGRGLGWLYVPGFGPFIPPFFGGHTAWGVSLLVLDGIAQSLSITAILVGALAPEAFGRTARFGPRSIGRVSWTAVPSAAGADVGLSVAGAFF